MELFAGLAVFFTGFFFGWFIGSLCRSIKVQESDSDIKDYSDCYSEYFNQED